MIPVCRHIKTNGVRCKAIALRERPYCYFHDRLHRILSRQNHGRNSFVLRPLEDRDSVFLALSDVVCALAAGEIDTQNATRIIHGLQVAGKYAPASSRPVANDAVKFVEFTRTGDELAPMLVICTKDDHCESCGQIKYCQIQQAIAWRAANPDALQDDQSGDDEMDENGEEDEDGEEDDADDSEDGADNDEDDEDDEEDDEFDEDDDDSDDANDSDDAEDRDVTPASLPAVVRASLPAPADPSAEKINKNEDPSHEHGKEVRAAQTQEADVGKNAA